MRYWVLERHGGVLMRGPHFPVEYWDSGRWVQQESLADYAMGTDPSDCPDIDLDSIPPERLPEGPRPFRRQ